MKKDLLTQIKRSLFIACLSAGVGASAQAPIAVDATNVLNGSCTANWGLVSGATGYKIDVSTQPDFSAGVPRPWINEFKYNTAEETGIEFFEVVVPSNYDEGTGLTVTLYNNQGQAYSSSPMSEWTLGMNPPSGHSVYYKETDIDAFGPAYLGGLALSHTVGGETTLIQFISFGSYPLTGADGPAAGAVSQQVPSPSLLNHGSRVRGTGGRYLDFEWETGTVSKGLKNNNQTLTPAASFPAYVAPYNNYNCGNAASVALNNLNSGVKYYYRVRAMNGTTASEHSNVISFQTLAPHTWTNDTWVLNGQEVGPPTIDDDVVIEDDFVFGPSGNGVFEARSLILLSGSLTVTSGSNLIVRRGIANYMSDAEFIVENNANIIQENGDIANIGEITVKKNSNPLFKLDYTAWSSPVAGQNLQSFSPLTLPNRFYEYDAATHTFISADVSEDFAIGKGYMIRMPNEYSLPGYNDGLAPLVYQGEFKGTLNNGTVMVPVSSANVGINLVGNPYASPINVHAFFDQNIMSLEAGSPIWVWRKRNNPDATSYATITKAGYTANFAQGGDASNGEFSSLDSETWVLNSGQGFFVRVQPDATAVLFTNSMRRDVNNNQLFRNNNNETEGQATVSRLRLNIAGSGEYEAAQAIVAYTDQGTLGLDYGWDGILFGAGSVSIYTKVGENKMAIQARPTFAPEDIVPLMFAASNAGNFTISLDQFTGVFEDESVNVFLKDNTTGAMHNLKDGEYTFVSEAGTFENRFEIVYTTNALGIDNPVADLNNVVVYKQGNTINIKSGNIEMSGVTVYDIRGRVMYDNQTISGYETSIDGLASSQQVLLVQISTPANGKVTKKIIH